MSHTVHPYSHRLGIIRDWKSRWFATKGKYPMMLRGDLIIRQYVDKKLRGSYIADIHIERSEKALRIILETSRPGAIIGRSGDGTTKLRDEITKLLKSKKLLGNQEVKLDIREVKSPESNAMIVAQMVAEGLEKRLPYRRVQKQMVEKVMANRDVKGVKITIGGRLAGSSIARSETRKLGRIPLQTMRADIDYAHYEGKLPYGNLGIKVWIYKGDIFAKQLEINN
ncbi:MAG: 30S ribosomal protein S3 [Minisyncoccia bacterium]